MQKKCDHTSVGMLVWKDEKLLLIERRKFPFGFAIPAGHVDGDSTFEDAAIRELREEVGLDSINLEPVYDIKKENPCRREDGTWHHWKIFKTEIIGEGELKRSESETKQANWFDKDQIRALAEKTARYFDKKISDEEWEKSPGLEPVMYEFFKELKII